MLGQLAFGFFILVCTVLLPHYLFEKNEGGISNFGVRSLTAIPYSLAFGLAGIFTLQGVKKLQTKTGVQRKLKVALAVLGFMYLAVLVSTFPYKVNGAFNDLHQAVSVLFIILELLLGVWFAFMVHRNVWTYFLLAALIIGFILATLTHFNLIHVLFIAELLIGLSFGALLVLTVSKIDTLKLLHDR